MRSFFLFYLLSSLLGNPFLALIVLLAFTYGVEARWSGRWFDPSRYFVHRRTINQLRATLEGNPHNAAAHNDLGRLLAVDGRFAEALPHMQRAVERIDESPEAHYYYGLCLLEAGKPTEGEREVIRALQIRPRFLYGEPQVRLARYHFDAGRAAEAASWADQAVHLNTSSMEGWVLLGRARRGLADASGARAAFEEARRAYRQLPGYLRLPNRRWLAAARREARTLPA